MNKVLPDAASAAAMIPDGATIMMGGFGLCGIPENLIAALHERGTGNLTAVSNNAGVDDFGLGILLQSRQVTRMVATYVGENKEFERQFLAGEIEVELVPQGTFAERLRAGGRRHRRVLHADRLRHGSCRRQGDAHHQRPRHVLEAPLHADFAFVKAWKGDRLGNLVYHRTAQNFNPMMAAAAKVTIAEVDELVDPGTFDPDLVDTPSIYVQHIVECPHSEKRIEKLVLRND